jgi:hypothetical protein
MNQKVHKSIKLAFDLTDKFAAIFKSLKCQGFPTEYSIIRKSKEVGSSYRLYSIIRKSKEVGSSYRLYSISDFLIIEYNL